MNKETDIAWAAGLFEGEGCIMSSGPSRYHGIQLTLNSTDEDVVRKFYEIVGVGNFSGPFMYKSSKMKKPQWRWQTAKQAHVLFVICKFFPYLSQRRKEKAVEVIRNRIIAQSTYKKKFIKTNKIFDDLKNLQRERVTNVPQESKEVSKSN
jgi:hypothetical protein